MTNSKPLPAIIHLPPEALMPAFPKRRPPLGQIKQAIHDLKRTAAPGSTPDFVARVNDRVDRVLALEFETREEALAMLALVLASDGEALDNAPRAALERSLAVLRASA